LYFFTWENEVCLYGGFRAGSRGWDTSDAGYTHVRNAEKLKMPRCIGSEKVRVVEVEDVLE